MSFRVMSKKQNAIAREIFENRFFLSSEVFKYICTTLQLTDCAIKTEATPMPKYVTVSELETP